MQRVGTRAGSQVVEVEREHSDGPPGAVELRGARAGTTGPRVIHHC